MLLQNKFPSDTPVCRITVVASDDCGWFKEMQTSIFSPDSRWWRCSQTSLPQGWHRVSQFRGRIIQRLHLKTYCIKEGSGFKVLFVIPEGQFVAQPALNKYRKYNNHTYQPTPKSYINTMVAGTKGATRLSSVKGLLQLRPSFNWATNPPGGETYPKIHCTPTKPRQRITLLNVSVGFQLSSTANGTTVKALEPQVFVKTVTCCQGC